VIWGDLEKLKKEKGKEKEMRIKVGKREKEKGKRLSCGWLWVNKKPWRRVGFFKCKSGSRQLHRLGIPAYKIDLHILQMIAENM
jgi:hypothetical protein